MYTKIPKLKPKKIYIYYLIMDINEFFNVAEEFFNLINPNICEYYDEDYDQDYESELWKLCDDFFKQMRQQF